MSENETVELSPTENLIGALEVGQLHFCRRSIQHSYAWQGARCTGCREG